MSERVDPPFVQDRQDNHLLKTHYLFTLAPRFGYAFGKWLPYVTAGLAVGDLDFSQHVDLTFFDEGRVASEGGSDRETDAGWMVGEACSTLFVVVGV